MNPLASKLFVSVVVMLEAAAISPRMSLVLLVLLVGAASAQFSSSSDYCRFSGKHTMCRYKGVAPECSHHHDREDILTIMILMTVIMMMRVIMRGEDAGYRGVSDADIKEILEYHNRSGHSLDKSVALLTFNLLAIYIREQKQSVLLQSLSSPGPALVLVHKT